MRIHFLEFFFFIGRPAHSSPLFPYTTLFRSLRFGPTARMGHRPGPVAVFRLHGGSKSGSVASRFAGEGDRKSTRLNSSHTVISYAVFRLKKKNRLACAVGAARPHRVCGVSEQ